MFVAQFHDFTTDGAIAQHSPRSAADTAEKLFSRRAQLAG
jgi:hypothetical protein